MDHTTLSRLRPQQAGRRLTSDASKPFVASFLHVAHIQPNARAIGRVGR